MSKPVMLYRSRTTITHGEHGEQLEHESRCKGRQLYLTKERGTNWYIQVVEANGTYAYNGYWDHSFDKTLEEAIVEARRGACIDEPLTSDAVCEECKQSKWHHRHDCSLFPL